MDGVSHAVYLRAHPYAKDALNLPVGSVDSAAPYYERFFGFRVEQTLSEPVKTVILSRDEIKIGLAENGGDPSQEGCFFEVNDVELAFAELKQNGLPIENPNYRIDHHGAASFKVFFVIAPDGLCYCLGQRMHTREAEAPSA